ncbi:hypothetical protein WY02_14805 [Pseudonocardia sp. AL041005-10]|nr:hypothetical protein WY02_14805 [Pseudonocardia sp. AL041005-10]
MPSTTSAIGVISAALAVPVRPSITSGAATAAAARPAIRRLSMTVPSFGELSYAPRVEDRSVRFPGSGSTRNRPLTSMRSPSSVGHIDGDDDHPRNLDNQYPG